MAHYILYYPNNIEGTREFKPQLHDFAYCTDVMMHSIRDELLSMGHTVDILYFPVKNFNGRGLIDCEIPELGINVQRVPTSLWFIIANDDTKNFVLVDLQDSPVATFALTKHKNLIFSLIGQFSMERYRLEMDGILDLTKIIPFVYCPYYPIYTRKFREHIQDIRNSAAKLDDRLFFYGNNNDSYVWMDTMLHARPQKIREVITILEQKYPDETCVGGMDAKLPLEEWFKKAATHTINLALPGHQWCSREHELWTLGLPVMMYEHTHMMAINPIPNHHYVSVSVGQRLLIGMAKDPEYAADRIIQTHREWIKPVNRWRLNAIARHGQDRMDNFASPEVIGKTTLNLLELGNW